MLFEKNWEKQRQEREGDYWFDGKMYITCGIANNLTPQEIAQICHDLKEFVYNMNGADYLQVFKKDGRKVFCIDQLSKPMLEGDDYTPEQKEEYHYWTMLFAEEY